MFIIITTIGFSILQSVLILFLLLKQNISKANYIETTQRFEEQLIQFVKQSQNAHQDLRENLLLQLSSIQQLMTEKLSHAHLEQTQIHAQLKEKRSEERRV